MIYLTRPSLPPIKDYLKYLKVIWRGKQLSNNGPLHKLLEKKLEKFLKVKNLVLTANGTLGIQLAIKALNLKGEIITTPFTFAATTTAIVWEGLKPVFADINPETFNLDPKSVEKKITKKTSAILAVHVFGNPCYPEELERIARKHRIKLIFDAAHAFGVKYKNHSLFSYGDASILSFHATKVFNTAEGGAIVARDKEIYKKIQLLRNFGLQKSGENAVVIPGINAKMSEFQAALGLSNLKFFNQNLKKRRERYRYYRRLLVGLEKIKSQKIITAGYNYAYLPLIFQRKDVRDRIYRSLWRGNVAARKYFYPLTSNFLKNKKNLPVAEKTADSILCLPLYPDLPLNVIKNIVKIIGRNL